MTSTCENDAVAQALTNHIEEEFLYEGGILTGDFPLVDQGVIDSMGIFRLISFLEEEYGVTVEPEEVVIENFATIAAIAHLVARKIGDG